MNKAVVLKTLANGTKHERKEAAKFFNPRTPASPANYSALTLDEKKELLRIGKSAEMVNGVVNYDSLELNDLLTMQRLLEKARTGNPQTPKNL